MVCLESEEELDAVLSVLNPEERGLAKKVVSRIQKMSKEKKKVWAIKKLTEIGLDCEKRRRA